MAKRTSTKTTGANLTVPQSREEAAAALARIGALGRQITRAETALNDKVTALKQAAEAAAAPAQDEIVALTEGLKIWAEANRKALTGGDRTKTVNLGTGELRWRIQPPRVTLRGSVEAIIDACRTAGFGRFVRVKEEISREAMLAEPDVARSIPGVSVGTAGESFVVEPFEVEIQGGPAA